MHRSNSVSCAILENIVSKFKVGDVVRLKSGSPAMTLLSWESDVITCCWFPLGSLVPFGGGYLPCERENFPVDALVLNSEYPHTKAERE